VSEITPIVDDQEMLRAYAETIKLKDALLSRAAAALDSYHKFRKEHLVDCNTCELIAELRKAAE
jgi:hypothetical protein